MLMTDLYCKYEKGRGKKRYLISLPRERIALTLILTLPFNLYPAVRDFIQCLGVMLCIYAVSIDHYSFINIVQ